MPTNKERREVAKELRYTARHSLNGYSFQRSVEGTVFGTIEDRTWRETLTRLADLIEPEPERTCRMELNWDYDGDCPAYYRDYVCSECKEDFIYYKHSRVSYCPNCGAKVASDD